MHASLLRRCPVPLVVLLALGPAALAEPAYISARLEIGLHESRSPHSAILALLPEGTEIEVIERDAGAARVRLADGREGWIAAQYLSSESSAPAELGALRQRIPELEAALASEQAARIEAEGRTSAAEAELSELRSGVTSAGASADSGEGGDDSQILRDFQLLAEENRQLKEQVAELEEMRKSAGESGAGAASSAIQRHEGVRAHPPGFFERPTWQWILIAFVLLFSFGLGAFAVDWLTRRRHGGYRI